MDSHHISMMLLGEAKSCSRGPTAEREFLPMHVHLFRERSSHS